MVTLVEPEAPVRAAPPLAIDGGEPVRSAFLPFGAPCFGEEEIEEVAATLRSGWITTGPRARLFEEEFAAYVGARYAVSLNSCTAGLFLGLKLFDIGPGDVVLTTPLTFAATANVVEHLGTRPVFVDVDPSTLNIEPNKVEDTVKRWRNTPSLARQGRIRAIIPVHFGGLACDMDALHDIAARYELHIVEDAAHAVSTRYRGRMVGNLGSLAAFSFYANKNLSTGEGGMLTTDDPQLDEQLRILRLHGLNRDAWKRFGPRRVVTEVIVPGYKFNMPDIMAALGIQQLRKQEHFLAIRERYAELYDQAFTDLPVERQYRPPACHTAGPGGALPSDRHALHLYVLILREGAFRVTRDEILDALLAENIGVSLHFRALHVHKWYREKYGYEPQDFPEAYRIGEHILSLPLTPGMSADDAQDVIAGVRKVLGAYEAYS